jgi:hypothetical protein
MEKSLHSLSSKSETAGAIRYALSHWRALTRYVNDGLLEIDNSAAERSLRAVAIGRKNYLFMGADSGGQSAASLYSTLSGLPSHWVSQTQRPRSSLLSAHGSGDDRGTSDQPHPGTAALERCRLTPDRHFPSRVDPLNKCPLKN